MEKLADDELLPKANFVVGALAKSRIFFAFATKSHR